MVDLILNRSDVMTIEQLREVHGIVQDAVMRHTEYVTIAPNKMHKQLDRYLLYMTFILDMYEFVLGHGDRFDERLAMELMEHTPEQDIRLQSWYGQGPRNLLPDFDEDGIFSPMMV